MKFLWWLALVLVVLGGLNMGLVGFFNYDLLNTLLGEWPVVVTVAYDVVGVAAVVLFVSSIAHNCCDHCKK